MIVHFPLLLLGLALLWFPRSWMRLGRVVGKRRRKRTESNIVEPWNARAAGDPRVFFRDEFTKLRNYVDLGRALAGGLTLLGGLGITSALEVPDDAPHRASLQALAIRAVILLVGVLIQATRYENRRISFFPPIFFLAGLTIGLCGPKAAIFAFILIWTLNTAISNPQAFLTVYAVALAVFGYFFAASRLNLILAAGLVFLPVLLSMLANRPLAVFSRKSTRAPGSP